MTILAGARSFKQIKAAVRNGLLSMQKVSWVVSPIALIFAQNFLPQYTWVPFFNIVAFGMLRNALRTMHSLQLTPIATSFRYIHEYNDQEATSAGRERSRQAAVNR